MDEIKKITQEEATKIIDERKPLGLFYLIEKSPVKGNIYVGIDNTTGDAWTEDFKSLGTCKRWLQGLPVRVRR